MCIIAISRNTRTIHLCIIVIRNELSNSDHVVIRNELSKYSLYGLFAHLFYPFLLFLMLNVIVLSETITRKDQMTSVILKTNASHHRGGLRNQTLIASKNPAQDTKGKVATNTTLQMKSPASTGSNPKRVHIQKERETGSHITRRDPYLRHLQTGSVADNNTRGISTVPLVADTMKSLHWNRGR